MVTSATDYGTTYVILGWLSLCNTFTIIMPKTLTLYTVGLLKPNDNNNKLIYSNIITLTPQSVLGQVTLLLF